MKDHTSKASTPPRADSGHTPPTGVHRYRCSHLPQHPSSKSSRNASLNCSYPPASAMRCSSSGPPIISPPAHCHHGCILPPGYLPLSDHGGGCVHGPITSGPTSSSGIGVASPPSPRCYDIIEEDMIFQMSDINEVKLNPNCKLPFRPIGWSMEASFGTFHCNSFQVHRISFG